jgi:ABC-type branched-subunit amino acid transport system substrate-binding protein
MSGIPIKFGVLHDAPAINPQNPLFHGLAIKLDEVNGAGGVQGRKIELVYEAANGAHDGLPENAAAGWKRLAANPEVVGIFGPGITDNVLACVETVNAGRAPTIQWSGSDKGRSEWMFHYQAGSLQDEPVYLAQLMARLGHKRVGLLQTEGPVGDQYYDAFRIAARPRGLEIVAHQFAHVHATDVTPQLRRLREAKPDCLLFLGMQEPTLAFGQGIRALRWDIPRFSNIAMLAVGRSPADARMNEGIVWVDQYDTRNPVLRRLNAAYEKRYKRPAPLVFTHGIGYDMMTLMAEGLRLAPNLSRAALKAGLEQVRQLPCALGGMNPVMGFGPWDRAAIKGPDLLMYRTVRNGKLVTYEG